MSPRLWRVADGHLVLDPVAEAPRNRILHGNCITVMATLPPASVTSLGRGRVHCPWGCCWCSGS
jgi:hypothetical protein